MEEGRGGRERERERERKGRKGLREKQNFLTIISTSNPSKFGTTISGILCLMTINPPVILLYKFCQDQRIIHY